jgi:hypothetical protein
MQLHISGAKTSLPYLAHPWTFLFIFHLFVTLMHSDLGLIKTLISTKARLLFGLALLSSLLSLQPDSLSGNHLAFARVSASLALWTHVYYLTLIS